MEGSEQLIYNVLIVLNTGLIHGPYLVQSASSVYSFETYVLSWKYELSLEFVPLEKWMN